MSTNCHYIKANGAQCGAIALADKRFCFWHSRIRVFHAEANAPAMFPKYYNQHNDVLSREKNEVVDQYFANTRLNGPTSKELPPLEDPESIQLALSLLVAAIADNRIEAKRASLMLYGLQLASINVRHIRPALEDSIQHIALDETGMEVAAAAPQ